MRLPLPRIASRRRQPAARGGRIDLRNTMRQMFRDPDGFAEPRRHAPRPRPVPLVILCDISGSMESYTRMLLHFTHAISNDLARVHTFLFGTRLSDITRALRARDVDIALG